MSADTGRGPRTEALTALAELRLRQGTPEAALELLENADATAWGAVTQASCLVAIGRADEARALLHGELVVHDQQDPAFPAIVAALVEIDLLAGNVEEAAALVAPDAPAWRVSAFPRAAALLTRAAGLVAGVHGDETSARRQLAFALEIFARLELPFEAARTELDLARLLAPSRPGRCRGKGEICAEAAGSTGRPSRGRPSSPVLASPWDHPTSGSPIGRGAHRPRAGRADPAGTRTNKPRNWSAPLPQPPHGRSPRK